MIRRLRAMSHDTSGATILEFALVLPVMLLLIMGLFDLCYQGYVQAVLSGALQKAGRDSTIQGNDTTTATAAIDDKVMAMVRTVARQATYKSERLSYGKFGDVAPERFDDANNNRRYDAGECFYDINANRTWDADPGLTGQGGASDVVVYKMTITYPRLFPLAALVGWSRDQQLAATTILKNQPYKTQAGNGVVRICS